MNAAPPSTRSPVFPSAADVDPDHLTAVLRRHGLLAGGCVIGIDVEPVGHGQMADCARLRLTYRDATDGPSSIIAKCAARDERSRATGKALRAYEVEVGFYRELAPTIEVSLPACYDAAIDLDTGSFTLLLEDLAPAAAGDQLVGCDADLADRVLAEAVGLHAPRWADPSLASIGWLARLTPDRAAKTARLIAGLYPSFLERFGSYLDDDVTTCLDHAIDGAEDWWAPRNAHRTIQHGDLRLDNLLIDGDGDRIWMVDWQTVTLGAALGDVSYFIGGNLPVEDRRRNEEDLVGEYHRRLVAAGVSGYGWDDCWRDYRWYAWSGVYMTIGASMLVEQTDRGDRMFVTDIIRHARHALDLDAGSLLAGCSDV